MDHLQQLESLAARPSRLMSAALGCGRPWITREDAEDAVQQALTKAFINLSQFRGQSKLTTWITRILINEVLMMKRKGRVKRERTFYLSDVNVEEFTRQITAPILLSEHVCDVKARLAEALAAIGQLPPEQRHAVGCILRGEDMQEVAARTGKKYTTVKANLHRGREKLQSQLALAKGAGA